MSADRPAACSAPAFERRYGLRNVEVVCADVATDAPPGPFDLIVFSEIGYYFPVGLLAQIARSMAGKLNVGGDFVAVHWLGDSTDHVMHGDAVHRELLANLPLRWLIGARRSWIDLGGPPALNCSASIRRSHVSIWH